MSNENIPFFSSILLLGPPGSGKGSLAKLLDKIGLGIHVSTGDIFRRLPKNSPDEQLFRKSSGKGELFPDKRAIAIFLQHVTTILESKSYQKNPKPLLLDGIPRTVAQSRALEPYLKLQQIILLEVLDATVLVERINNRAQLEGRNDDRQQILQSRLKDYECHIGPILDYYQGQSLLKISAEQPIIHVLKDALNGLLGQK